MMVVGQCNDSRLSALKIGAIPGAFAYDKESFKLQRLFVDLAYLFPS